MTNQVTKPLAQGSATQSQPWMDGFYDAVRIIGGHLRAKEFVDAERVFERFLAKSRREAAKPAAKRRLDHSTPLYDVLDERIAHSLEMAGYLTLGSVTAARDEELLRVPLVGTLSLAEIRKVAPHPEHQPMHELLSKM